MPRRPGCINVLGADGNLPRYKVNDNPCNIDITKVTMPGVTLNNFKEYHIRCPFDTAPSDLYEAHLVRNTNPSSANYWNFEVAVPPHQRAGHTTTSGIMIRWSRGSKHGWLCVDDECPYHKGITVTYSGIDAVISKPGDRYFYF